MSKTGSDRGKGQGDELEALGSTRREPVVGHLITLLKVNTVAAQCLCSIISTL